VKDLGQNLQTFDDARSRAVEILFAVGDEDATLLSSLQLVPTRAALETRNLPKRPRYVKAARVYEDDIWIGDNNLVPIEPWRRLALYLQVEICGGGCFAVWARKRRGQVQRTAGHCQAGRREYGASR
jgi:hypothetical protein